MKIKHITIPLVVIALCFVASCSHDPQKKTEVYSFSGGNDFIEINNGIFIITDEVKKFIGGDLTFKTEELSGAKEYITKFNYYNKDGVETSVQHYSTRVVGSSEGTSISPEMGETSGKTLFTEEDWGLIKKSLNWFRY